MTDELIDICDEKNNLLGIQKMKSDAHKNGLWHRASHVWIYNSKGEILIQLRSKSKDIAPNVWDISAAGHIATGEKPLECAIRELKEEIGLDAKSEDIDFFKIAIIDASWPGIRNREFWYTYLLKFDGDVKDLAIQNSEIQAVKFIPISKLEEELKNNHQNYAPNVMWKEIIDEVRRRL